MGSLGAELRFFCKAEGHYKNADLNKKPAHWSFGETEIGKVKILLWKLGRLMDDQGHIAWPWTSKLGKHPR